MKKSFLLTTSIILSLSLTFFSCGKDEDPPEPTPTTTSNNPPAPTTSTDTYISGSGWGASDVNLKVLTMSNIQVFWNSIISTNAQFTINLDETYKYEVTYNIPNVTVTGTYGISSSSGLWFQEDAPTGVIGFWRDSQGNIVIYKI